MTVASHTEFLDADIISRMPNIAQAIKQEIARVARREIRSETQPLKSAAARYRSDIAALKRQVATLERKLRRATKGAGEHSQQSAASVKSEQRHRFSAKGFAMQRARLGLSAREMAQLLCVSQLSVYKWEQGKARPRAKQLAAIASVRKMGKREVAAKLKAEVAPQI